jgi:hypothetical protein
MLLNEFDSYYITGLKFSWNLSNFYTSGRERSIIHFSQDRIDVQRKTFAFNLNARLATQQSETDQLREMIAKDDEIIALHKRVVAVSMSQMDNGAISALELIQVMNGQMVAELAKEQHQIALMKALKTIELIEGNEYEY